MGGLIADSILPRLTGIYVKTAVIGRLVGDRQEIVAALDWTEYDADDQSTFVLSMVTGHGRATPLLWKTVVKSKLTTEQPARQHSASGDEVARVVAGVSAEGRGT
jgi:hypothetical protein